MATYTTNYNLPKYEASDLPNLLDQYNSSMDKIDAQLKTTDNAATQAGTAAGNANTTAQQALSLAQTNEGAIEGLETDVAGVKSQLSTQEQSIAAHATELQDHESRITALKSTTDELSEQVSSNTAAISAKAPISHASTAGTYGLGSVTNFGHVRLSDEAGTDGASQGVAATPKAIQDAIDQLGLDVQQLWSGDLDLTGKSTITQGLLKVNVIRYGLITAVSFGCDPNKGITSSGAVKTGAVYIDYTLPVGMRPSRPLYLPAETSGNWAIQTYVGDDGKIGYLINTTEAIRTPWRAAGNSMFIGAN